MRPSILLILYTLAILLLDYLRLRYSQSVPTASRSTTTPSTLSPHLPTHRRTRAPPPYSYRWILILLSLSLFSAGYLAKWTQRSNAFKRGTTVLSQLAMSEGGEVVLCFGSALGAWRSGGAMSWDRDVDVCVSQQFLTRLLERERTEQSLANTGFALVDQRGPRGVRDDVIGARLVHTTTDFYIDLWSLHEAQVRTADQVVPLLCTGDSSFLFADIAFTRQPDAIASFTDGKLAPIRSPEEELFATSPDGSKRWPRRMCLPRSWYFPSVNCSYDNIPGVQCPAHVHEVLAARYGQPLTAPSAWTYCYPTFYSWQGLGRALTAVAVFHWMLPRLLQPRKRARAPWLNGHRVAAILACAVTVLYVEVAHRQ